MSSRAVAHAAWHAHVNGVNPAPALRDWLTDTASLTRKLSSRCARFRVKRLRQAGALCLADECGAIGLARRVRVHERDVLLECDGQPMVFAHTVVPLTATLSDWPFFSTLGERSLGTTLFGDPRVLRGALQYARLPAAHSLCRRAGMALGQEFAGPLHARRCLYRRGKGVLLVTEVFLPAISALGVERAAGRDAAPRNQSS